MWEALIPDKHKDLGSFKKTKKPKKHFQSKKEKLGDKHKQEWNHLLYEIKWPKGGTEPQTYIRS
jgi:hypothetical protein